MANVVTGGFQCNCSKFRKRRNFEDARTPAARGAILYQRFGLVQPRHLSSFRTRSCQVGAIIYSPTVAFVQTPARRCSPGRFLDQ